MITLVQIVSGRFTAGNHRLQENVIVILPRKGPDTHILRMLPQEHADEGTFPRWDESVCPTNLLSQWQQRCSQMRCPSLAAAYRSYPGSKGKL